MAPHFFSAGFNFGLVALSRYMCDQYVREDLFYGVSNSGTGLLRVDRNVTAGIGATSI